MFVDCLLWLHIRFPIWLGHCVCCKGGESKSSFFSARLFMCQRMGMFRVGFWSCHDATHQGQIIMCTSNTIWLRGVGCQPGHVSSRSSMDVTELLTLWRLSNPPATSPSYLSSLDAPWLRHTSKPAQAWRRLRIVQHVPTLLRMERTRVTHMSVGPGSQSTWNMILDPRGSRNQDADGGGQN